MKKKLLVYIVIGVIGAAVFAAGWAWIDTLLGRATDFVDGLKNVMNLILAVIFGIGLAVTMWKKDNKGDSK